MSYKIVIEPRAIFDIQNAVDYYDLKQVGLGKYFYQSLEEAIEVLSKNTSFKLDIRIIMVFPLKNFHS